MGANARMFVALDAGADVTAALGRVVARGRAQAPRAAWARRDAAHLTLVFLGEVPEDRIAVVCAAVRDAVGGHPPLTLRVEGAGVFGHPAHPRVLWAGVDGGRAPLDALVTDLRRALDACGVETETRPFHPHLTLARARGPRGDAGLARCATALADHAFGVISAEAVTVYRSELRASGARHHVVERCPLRGPGC